MTENVAARLSTPARRPSLIPPPRLNAKPDLRLDDSLNLTAAAALNPAILWNVLETLAAGVRQFGEELGRLHQREQAHLETIRLMREQLDLTASVQRNLLPGRLPEVQGLEVGVLYRPAAVVSGDLYDVVRLDDSHVAFTVADATGHGLPAAFLSAFVKRAFRGVESTAGGPRRLRPDEVLRRVNRELCEAELIDCQFVAALYAVYDETSGRLRWARGGAPYPILSRRGAEPQRITSAGPLVGACDDPQFEVVELQLHPGDRIILHTDGTDSLGDLTEAPCLDGRALEDRVSALQDAGSITDDVTIVSLRRSA
jgi:serine phosphatase RsbU (regulator of sigma subunit)